MVITIEELREILPQITIQSIKAGPTEPWDNGSGYIEAHVPTIIDATQEGVNVVYRLEHPPEVVRVMIAPR